MKRTKSVEHKKDSRKLLCENLGFAASEAYKLLRTNIAFSLGKSSDCPVIGITSSDSGEGKTTVAINLAYTLAEGGKKTLIIDGDLRLPAISKYLSIKRTPGLSDLLAGLSDKASCIKPSGIIEHWDVLTAGTIPPNPSELLACTAMRDWINKLRSQYDFIIIDLPPVGIVSDALSVSEYIDGLIMIVRQNYTRRRALANSSSILRPLGNKLLGIVVTDSTSNKKDYYYHSYAYGDESKGKRSEEG